MSLSSRPVHDTGEPPRRLLIARHGVTDHNAGAIWQGHLDTALNATGQAQARAAARAIAAMRPALVVSSDLARARHTGETVAAACELPLRIDGRLKEIDVGGWQGLSHSQVLEAFPEAVSAIAEGEDLARGEHGETVSDVVARARPAVDEIIAELDPGDLGVLVTHGVTGRSLVADLTGIDQRTAWTSFIGLRNCHWAVLEEHGEGWRVQAWNVGPE